MLCERDMEPNRISGGFTYTGDHGTFPLVRLQPEIGGMKSNIQKGRERMLQTKGRACGHLAAGESTEMEGYWGWSASGERATQ